MMDEPQPTRTQREWSALCAGLIALISGAVAVNIAIAGHGGLGFLAGVAIVLLGLFIVPRALGLEEARAQLIGYTVLSICVIWPITLIVGMLLSPTV